LRQLLNYSCILFGIFQSKEGVQLVIDCISRTLLQDLQWFEGDARPDWLKTTAHCAEWSGLLSRRLIDEAIKFAIDDVVAPWTAIVLNLEPSSVLQFLVIPSSNSFLAVRN